MSTHGKVGNLAEIKALQKALDRRLSHHIRTLFRRQYWQFSIGVSSGLKRLLDIVVSLVALCVLFMPFVLLAVLIKMTSHGPAVYVQTRVGQGGGHFKFYKFRSMYHEAPDEDAVRDSSKEIGVQKDLPLNTPANDEADLDRIPLESRSVAIAGGGHEAALAKIQEYRRLLSVDPEKEVRSKVDPNDPNITPMGRFIRKTSIDELPQFYNVLVGEMSLVGPRPPVPSEVERYSLEARKRLDVRPGLTCLWQIRGRSDFTFEQQVDLDKEYILSQSLVRDLVILVQTIPAIIIGRGAY